jgi:putative phage-type endonuclease
MVAADPITLVPGSPEWLRELTASKVAAVLGLSPWQSRFSLWYRMSGGLPEEPQTPEQSRGHYLEDGVARWLGDVYDLNLIPGGCWRNRDRPWQVACPDRLVTTLMQQQTGGTGYRIPTAVVEVKTAAKFEDWGPDGTDEVPPYYRAQAVWQCDTLGVPRCYMGVLLPFLELRGYVIEPAPGEAEYIREECREFLDSLEAGEPPDVDEHDATWTALRALNPNIVDEDSLVEAELAIGYARAVLNLKAAETEHTLRRNQLAQHMGLARRAVYDERTLAIRQPGPTGIPFVKAGTARALRAITEEE